MNKYLHAVGLCIGLTAVIILSALNALSMTESEWLDALNKPQMNHTVYSLGWLISYVITAGIAGEFVINKSIRKTVFLPVIFMVFTGLAFFVFYRLHSAEAAAVMIGGAAATELAILFITLKHARFIWAGALINILWYSFMFGFVVTVCEMN